MRVWIVICAFILAGNLSAQNKINRYEYWFDSNFAGRTTSTISPVQNFTLNTTVSAVALVPGLHVLHIRFCDENMVWSSCASQFFFRIPPVAASVSITGYEYWYDNNYAGRTFTTVASQQNTTVNASMNGAPLVQGLHTAHIRFVDSEGNWSSVLSQFFFRSPSSTSVAQEVNAYQYWFDNNHSSIVTASIAPGQNVTVVASLNAASLTGGLHTIHFRFRQTAGEWSSVISQFFYRSASGSATAISAYQYWFDNQFPTAITQTVAPQQNFTLNTNISASALSEGLHAFYIRFQDSTGQWSSATSQFFHVYPQSGNVSAIDSYRYWFDQNDSAMVQQQISPVQNATVAASISMITIPQGSHMFHIQFRDSLGNWSSATTDTIQKLPLPIAMFSVNDTIFCDSGTVTFMDHSIDGDQFLWHFGDGDSSFVQNPVHQYNQPGLYTVQLSVSDSVSGEDTSTVRFQYIRVYDTPSSALTLASNDSICSGQAAIISADTSAIYSWNTGDTTQSISTNTSGDYWAIVFNTQHQACSTITDTVHVTVMPLPVVVLGMDTSICENTQLVLDVNGSGTNYLWSTGASTPTITVTNPGGYWVTVTSSFGCQNTDTIIVGVDSLPTAGFTNSVTANSVSLTDQSLYATTWLWDFGDGNFSSQQNPTHVYSASGNYTITLVVSNGCDSDTITDIVLITGTEPFSNSNSGSILLYPNPASESVNITFIASDAGNTLIDVLNINGELVAPVLNTTAATGTVITAELNVSGLANGMYVVRVNSGSEVSTMRLVIAR